MKKKIDVPTVGGLGLAAVLILYLYGSAFQIFHNFYQNAVSKATPHALWFTLGIVFTAVWVGILVWGIKNGVKGLLPIIGIFAFLVLAVCSFCGFSYPYNF